MPFGCRTAEAQGARPAIAYLPGAHRPAAADRKHRVRAGGLFHQPRAQRTIRPRQRNLGAAGTARVRPDGSIVPRNNFVGSPIHRFDVRIQRRIKIGTHRSLDGCAGPRGSRPPWSAFGRVRATGPPSSPCGTHHGTVEGHRGVGSELRDGWLYAGRRRILIAGCHILDHPEPPAVGRDVIGSAGHCLSTPAEATKIPRAEHSRRRGPVLTGPFVFWGG